MSVTRAELETLSPSTRARLAEDLQTYGRAAVGRTLAEVRLLVGRPRYRADVLHAWLRHHGSADPVRTGPASPRTERPPTPAAPRPRTHVIFGDAHAAPGQDLRRFRDAGEIVRAEVERARVAGGSVVCVFLGDWYSFDSLCDHEKLRKRADARVREDVEAGELALESFHVGLGSPAGQVDLELHLTLGNHDVRVDKLTDDAPWFDGFYSVSAAHEARGWTVHRYLEPARIDGVRYQHYLTAKGSGRAIGGVNHARTLLARVHHRESVVVGHSHALQYVTERPHVGRPVHGIVAGSWLDHREEYAGEDNAAWWSGHVVLRGVREGDFESIEFHRRG